MTKLTSSTRYPVHWLGARLQNGRKVMLGICGRTKQPFTATNMKDGLTIIAVRDLYVDETVQHCEEGQRCVNTACPLNRTTRESMAHSMGLGRVPAWLKRIGIVPWPMEPELRAQVEALCTNDESVVVM